MRNRSTLPLIALSMCLAGTATGQDSSGQDSSGRDSAGAGQDYASSAQEIQPLLIGAQVPDVQLKTIDGDPVSIKDAMGDKPAVVIFYRGGW